MLEVVLEVKEVKEVIASLEVKDNTWRRKLLKLLEVKEVKEVIASLEVKDNTWRMKKDDTLVFLNTRD